MKRVYFDASISEFLSMEDDLILGKLADANDFALLQTQREAWKTQISILKNSLPKYKGKLYFEYSIPRMGKRIDVVLIISHVIFVLEFKVGEADFTKHASDQVWDYALDLKNFHEASHNSFVAPLLVASERMQMEKPTHLSASEDRIFLPIPCTTERLTDIIEEVLSFSKGPEIDAQVWLAGRYSPTPTIIEAAQALYRGHSVAEISRNDSTAKDLAATSAAIEEIIQS